MNDNPFEIKEEACASSPDHRRYLLIPRQALESAEHIIFHDNGICEMIPRAGSSKANIVPPTAADCGEEC